MSSATPPPEQPPSGGQPYPQGGPPYPQGYQSPPADPATTHRAGFGRALAATLLWAGVSLLLLFALAGPPSSARAAGAVVGTLVFSALLAALPTWLIVRRRPGGWPFWQVALIGLGFFLVLRLIVAAGAAGS